jgi:small nuclear ribonucleoprotein (snRNP)-like protein
MNIEKPLDALNNMRGKEVTIDLRNGETVEGKLIAFDLNTNITIEVNGDKRLVQGNNVVAVSNKN